jgi:dipeptidyl aminopeptidase/acylaminoacyl peptidase
MVNIKWLQKKSCASLKVFICLLTFFGSSGLYATPHSKGVPNVSTLSKVQQDLIPRAVLFSDPDRTRVQLSPNGEFLSYLAPYKGVLNIWVGKPSDPTEMHPLTDNTKRGISSYLWAYTNKHIIYVDDVEGNENWRIYRVDVLTGEKLALASFDKVQARLLARSKDDPEDILVELNKRKPEYFDIYRLNIITGKLSLVFENDRFSDFVADEHLNLKVTTESTEDGGARYYALIKDKDNQYQPKELFSIAQKDMFNTSPLFMNKAGDTLYMLDSRGRNTSALMGFNIETGKNNVIAEDNRVDISDVLVHPTERTIQATAATYTKPEWTLLDKSLAPDFEYLKTLKTEKGTSVTDVEVISRSLDDKSWIVVFLRDDGAPHYYFYDRTAKKAWFLFSGRPLLDKLSLNKMEPVIIPTRDKLSLVSYLSRPKHALPVPLVLYVHGGPSARDDWGYDAVHQWLTNRGYAVLSVNFRGSTGFGKAFANAGNGEWAGKMQDDLVDAVKWAINKGITTQDKVAIMGGSYGGYATLVGMTKSNDVFACGVDIVGPSNLETLMRSIPPYWKPFYALLKIMIGGDPETEEGRQFLASQSPLSFVDNIKKPLLIAQGANDPRVKQAESDQIVQAMELKNIPVTYVLYPDEGHGFSRPENRLSFYAVTEAFLAKHLGGRVEPVGEAFKNSSIQIQKGKETIFGE